MNDPLSDTYSPDSLSLQILCPIKVVGSDISLFLFYFNLYGLISV